MSETRPYGVLLDATTAIYIPLLKYATPTDFDGGTWVPAAGDVKVSKDGAAAANIGTLPTFVTDVGWKFILSATELTCKQITVRIADAATKVVCDDEFIVETFGNPSSMYPDPSTSSPVIADVQLINGVAANADTLADILSGVGASLAATTISIDATTKAALVDDVVNEVLGAARPAGSLGAQLTRPNGVATASGASTVTLAATESATDDIYNGRLIVILAGTGVGQKRRITDYVGATKIVTVDLAWTDAPDTTSRYVII